MNPSYLFSLSESKRIQYRTQPDLVQGKQITEPEEYEHPPFVTNAALRFWYNEQPNSYMTHWHNATEMITVLEQDYTVTVQNQTFHLEPGDILIIPPGALHSIQGSSNGPGSRFVFLFELTPFTSMYDFRFVRNAFSDAVLINQTLCPTIYEDEITTILNCAELYWSKSPIRLLEIYSKLLSFLICYTKSALNGQVLSKACVLSVTQSHTISIQALLTEIEADCKTIPNLEEAAARTGLSKFYFEKQFQKCTGRTYWSYISQLRLKKASQLLAETSESIGKIANCCGFHDLSSFNRSFKKEIGCTPSAYRKQFLSN